LSSAMKLEVAVATGVFAFIFGAFRLLVVGVLRLGAALEAVYVVGALAISGRAWKSSNSSSMTVMVCGMGSYRQK